MAGVAWKGTRAELVATLRQLASALAGTAPATGAARTVRAVLTRGAVAVLSKAQAAFVVKARGGTGDDGIKWRPLTRKTIAARRVGRDEKKALGIRGKRVRGLLTPAQDRRWRAIFASTLASFRARGVPGGEALAAQRAWAVLKSDGAKTKLDVLGGRTVEIGRDTGALFRSLTPGFEDAPARPRGQVLEAIPGRVTVGTNLPYADRFHRVRPLWPVGSKPLPEAWAKAMSEAIIRGLTLAVTRAAASKGDRT